MGHFINILNVKFIYFNFHLYFFYEILMDNTTTIFSFLLLN